MNSFFNKRFKQALKAATAAISVKCLIKTVAGDETPAPVSFDTDYEQTEYGGQELKNVACINREFLPVVEIGSVIEVIETGKKFKIEGCFTGKDYVSDAFEWCVAIREL